MPLGEVQQDPKFPVPPRHPKRHPSRPGPSGPNSVHKRTTTPNHTPHTQPPKGVNRAIGAARKPETNKPGERLPSPPASDANEKKSRRIRSTTTYVVIVPVPQDPTACIYKSLCDLLFQPRPYRPGVPSRSQPFLHQCQCSTHERHPDRSAWCDWSPYSAVYRRDDTCSLERR